MRLSGLAAPLPLLPSLNSVFLSEGACSSPQSEKPITDTPYLLAIFVAQFAHCMGNQQTGYNQLIKAQNLACSWHFGS